MTDALIVLAVFASAIAVTWTLDRLFSRPGATAVCAPSVVPPPPPGLLPGLLLAMEARRSLEAASVARVTAAMQEFSRAVAQTLDGIAAAMEPIAELGRMLREMEDVDVDG